jgi:hypothetical protein
MSTFNQLVSEAAKHSIGDVFFTFEPNELTEIHVNVTRQNIKVETFRSTNHMLDPVRKESFYGLYGMLGRQSLEDKFNEIISELN